MSPRVAIGLAAASLVLLAVVLFFTFHEKHETVDFGDVAGTLKLEDGVREGASLVAKIADPRWDTLPKEEQQKLAGQVFDVEFGKGIRAMTLRDGNGKIRVDANDAGGHRAVAVY